MDFIDSQLDNFVSMKPGMLLLIVLCGIGFALKRTNLFSNDWIPLLLMIFGAVIFPFIAEVGQEVSFMAPVAFNILVGAAIGLLSVGAHQFVIRTFRLDESNETKPN